MSDQSILQIDTDEELARVMRQLKTLPQQLGAPNVLKNALNSTARKVRQQIIKDSKGRYALKEKRRCNQKAKSFPPAPPPWRPPCWPKVPCGTLWTL